VTVAPGAAIRRARSAADRIGHVIACHPAPEEVTAALDEAQALIRLTITGHRTR
ncbi:hypothetical protein ACFWN1_29395, partial [Streptomyces sp. NPDC058459]|uniref:hypothetical protein n=1 Tax=Streptomyces sp. NPDC058459 TaxID=3346508 RepID=UPI003660D19C